MAWKPINPFEKMPVADTPDDMRAAIEDATAAVITAQVDAGVDIGNDGEQAGTVLSHDDSLQARRRCRDP